jgi:acyl-CoA-binding protein
MRGGNRLLTRLVAAWVQAAVDPDTDLPLFSGIRDVSKLADFECWAILGGTAIEASASHAIAVGDPDLAAAAARLGLAVH